MPVLERGLQWTVHLMRLRSHSLLIFFALVLAPRFVDACEPGEPFFKFSRHWPAPQAVDVPIDGLVVGLGYSFDEPKLVVEVSAGGESVAGSLVETTLERFVWRSDDPLAAGVEHTVHVESLREDDELGDSLDFTFTTGSGPATAPPQSIIESADVAVETSREQCVDVDCCTEFETVETVPTYRVDLDIAAPVGAFDGFYEAAVFVGATANDLASELSVHGQSGAGSGLRVRPRLGPVDEWPEGQFCFRVDIRDPLGQATAGEPTCLGEDDEPGEPATAEGCGCRSGGGGWPLLLATGLLLRLRRRRRTASV